MIVAVLNNNLIIIQRAIQAIKSKVTHRGNIIFLLNLLFGSTITPWELYEVSQVLLAPLQEVIARSK